MTARRSASFLAVALAAGALAAPSPAWALTCPASRPAVQVSVKTAEPAIDNTLPQPALQKLAGKAYHGGRTLGLYRATIRARWHTRVGQRDGHGETCRWIDSIAIDIVAPERAIFIIRERRPGTCWYDSVLAHERKHQATDDAVLAEFAPRLEHAVAQQRLMAPVEEAVRRVLDALEAERRARQALIDTPREYRRVGAACG